MAKYGSGSGINIVMLWKPWEGGAGATWAPPRKAGEEEALGGAGFGEKGSGLVTSVPRASSSIPRVLYTPKAKKGFS